MSAGQSSAFHIVLDLPGGVAESAFLRNILANSKATKRNGPAE